MSFQNASAASNSGRPVPLKQRTSSVDPRRDHDVQTVLSLTKLIKPREFFVTVDNFSIWRRHLAWALEDGADLRNYMTQRYSSSMVFMSLMLGIELSVLFNSAAVTSRMRQQLFAENFRCVEFWTGLTILISVIVTLLGLLSVFTAWGMVSSISDSNAHCILRSSIGQYVAELPGRFIVSAIYSFLLWVILFFFLLLPPGFWSALLAIITLGLYVHVVTVFSMFGRIIMHTGAMGSQKIFDEEFEQTLRPISLHSNLRSKALASLNNNISIMRQYRSKRGPLDHNFTSSDLDSTRSNGSMPTDEQRPSTPTATGVTRPRADSAVRFADMLWSSEPSRETSTAQQATLKYPSKKQDTSMRPPRPTSLRATNPVGSTNDDSVRSLEEWLKGSERGVSSETSSQQGLEVGSEAPEATPSNRFVSSNSSGSLEKDRRPLTPDEKFDLEYGDISFNHEETSDYGEQQGLLADDQAPNYFSTDGDSPSIEPKTSHKGLDLSK